MICPHCKKEISDKAVAKHLGKKAAGKKKTYSPEELAKRTARIIEAKRKSLSTPKPRK